MKKFLMPAVFFLVLSCNTSDYAKPAGENKDSTSMTHDSMSKMNTSTTVGALPAIPAGARVFFKNLKNDQSVNSPVKVEMGVENIRIDTAGPLVAGSGHFHILIDAEDVYPEGQMVPKDSTHLHYGKGQTEADVPLAPGKHKLTIQFADGLHRSYGSKLATTVTVNVKK